jgi:hypothetical protein
MQKIVEKLPRSNRIKILLLYQWNTKILGW